MQNCNGLRPGFLFLLRMAVSVTVVFHFYSLNGQELSLPNAQKSHQLYIDILRTSETSFYNEVLRKYDAYILNHPQDLHTQIEKCRFIDEAMYDSYEEYNPNQLQFDTCIQRLSDAYQDDLRVKSFVAEYVYGDSAISLLNEIIEEIESNNGVPENLNISDIYESAARNNSFADNHRIAIDYAEKAIQYSDSLNLSYFIASQLNEIGDEAKALEVLLDGMDSTLRGWQLNQCAELALELGNSEAAIKNFQWAERMDSDWISHGKYAEALIEQGHFTEGRKQLKIGANQNWSNTEQLFDLLEYDLKYMSADTAATTYNRLLEEGWEMDAFGVSRLRLIAQKNYWNLKWRDLTGPAMIILVLIFLFVLPYLWILPLQAIGLRRRNQGKIYVQEGFYWGLRNFWWLSFGYLAVNFIIMLVFYNENTIRFFFYDLEEIIVPSIDLVTSLSSLFFFIGVCTVVILLLKVKDLNLMKSKIWSHGKSIGIAFGIVVLLRLGLRFYRALAEIATFNFIDVGILSATIEFQAMLTFFGTFPTFIIVAVLVPIYEEYMFRGIILGACEKHIGFAWGNIVQAFLFAIIHFNFDLIPFYFVFGILAGILRNRSHSLAAPIYMHVFNNGLAVLYLASVMP